MRFIGLGLIVLGFFLVPARAAEDSKEKVDKIFAEYDKADSPGCALGVIRDGKFVYRKGYGMGSLELGVPLSPESVFYMGSVAKQFTAASVVLAAEQGFLSLDDNVRKYIPELPDYGHPITLRQMLHHTSGIRDFLTLLGLSGRDPATIHSEAELVDLIARQKNLNNNPGDEWRYSNTNYFLLGVVVKRATKKSLSEFATENIFKPLGMEHTRFYDDHTLVVPGRVAAYDPGRDGKFLVDWSTQYDLVGGGGLMSTVDDMFLWDRNFYENKLGKGTLVTELQTRGVLNNGKQISYALGLGMGTYRGLPTAEHDGALDGYRTVILRFPEQRFSVVCLCNLSSANTSSLAHKVSDIYMKNSLLPVTSEANSSGSGYPNPSKFAGTYLDPRKHFAYTFSASGDDLLAWGAKLQRIGPNQFKDLGIGTITFENSSEARKATLVIDGEVFFAGSRVDVMHLSDADLAAYAGRYRSTEIDATYILSLENGALMLRSNWDPPLKLNPVAPDEFESNLGISLVFDRGANGGVRGLRLFTENVHDISFEKLN